MKRLLMLLILILVLTLTIVNPVSADGPPWHVGNQKSSAYGVAADISTPASAPYIEETGTSSWVSTPIGYWIQTGWHWEEGMASAKSYYEYNLPGNPPVQQDVSTHSWGATKSYCLQFNGYTDEWEVYINEIKQWDQDGLDEPDITVQAMSEVHTSSENYLYTQFENVVYMDSDYDWFYFNEDNFQNAPPYYYVYETDEANYLCWGPYED